MQNQSEREVFSRQIHQAARELCTEEAKARIWLQISQQLKEREKQHQNDV